MPKAYDSKVSHTCRIEWNASVSLEIVPLQFNKTNNFEQGQTMAKVQLIKIKKACKMRCLTYEEATSHAISRLEPILGALDTIVYKKGDAEAKGVRDQL